MKQNTLPSRPAVPASKAEHCPECRHRLDDYALSHFPDCRYFWVENDTDDDLECAPLRAADVSHDATIVK